MFVATVCGEASFLRSHHWLKYRHIHRAKGRRCCGVAQGSDIYRTTGERNCRIRAVPGEDVLAREAQYPVPVARGCSAWGGDCFNRCPAPGDCVDTLACALFAAFGGWLVLVCGDAGAGNWTCAGGHATNGRSLHVSAIDRRVHYDHLVGAGMGSIWSERKDLHYSSKRSSRRVSVYDQPAAQFLAEQ